MEDDSGTSTLPAWMQEEKYVWKEKVTSSVSDMLNFKCQYVYNHLKMFSRQTAIKELKLRKKTKDGIRVMAKI